MHKAREAKTFCALGKFWLSKSPKFNGVIHCNNQYPAYAEIKMIPHCIINIHSGKITVTVLPTLEIDSLICYFNMETVELLLELLLEITHMV